MTSCLGPGDHYLTSVFYGSLTYYISITLPKRRLCHTIGCYLQRGRSGMVRWPQNSDWSKKGWCLHSLAHSLEPFKFFLATLPWCLFLWMTEPPQWSLRLIKPSLKPSDIFSYWRVVPLVSLIPCRPLQILDQSHGPTDNKSQEHPTSKRGLCFSRSGSEISLLIRFLSR